MSTSSDDPITNARPYFEAEHGRLMGEGHPAGDFLEAYKWTVTLEEEGHLVVEAHVPDQVRNPRGQLFGGFTGTYADLIGLHTVRAGAQRLDASVPRHWMATTNMRLDYFEPITGPTFTLDSRLIRSSGRTRYVRTEFRQGDVLAVLAITQWLVMGEMT